MRLQMACLVLGHVLIWAVVMFLAVFLMTVDPTAWPLWGVIGGFAITRLYRLAHSVPTLGGPSGTRQD